MVIIRFRVRLGVHSGTTKAGRRQLILFCPQEFGTKLKSIVNTFFFFFSLCIVLLAVISLMLGACKSESGV